MNDFYNFSPFNIVSVLAFILSIVSLVILSNKNFKNKFSTQNSSLDASFDNKTDINQINSKLKSKEKLISDLRTKLELKKSFEDELIKTIYEVEAKENFDSKLLQEIFPKNKHLPQSSIEITYLQPLFESGFSGFIGLTITSPV